MRMTEEDFKLTSTDELIELIKIINVENNQIKDLLEDDPTSKILKRKTVLVNKIEMNRILKTRVFQVLTDRNVDVELDESDQSNIKFKNLLSDITKIEFRTSSFFGKRKKYVISFAEEIVEILTTIDDPYARTYLSTIRKYPLTKSEFINEIRKLEIGEWRTEYVPEIFGYSILDGLQWGLEIYYHDEKYEIFGSNIYPYNYEELKDLFTLFDDTE